MNWTHGTFYSFDTETSGVSVLEDRIVTATVVKIENRRATDKKTWLLNPGVEIPEAATAVHGITTEDAREYGQDPALGVADIADVVTGVLRARFPLVVFNAAFDLSLLEAECRRHDLPSLTGLSMDTVIDPMVIAKGQRGDNREFVDPSTGKGWKYRLPDLCGQFGVSFTETHDATADATGAGLLACALMDTWNALPALSPAELFALQCRWRTRDQGSFRQWVAKQTPEKQANYGDIDTGWPLHTALTSQAVPA